MAASATHLTELNGDHIGFSEDRHFICYSQPPNCYNSIDDKIDSIDSIKIKARIEEWLERMEFLEEDLHWLLHLPAHRFWSQVVYDESLQKCLESYLCYAPRYHDISDSLVTEEMTTALQRIHRLVFMVFLRLSTYKESKSAHFTPQAFAEIIYENFVFDIPKIMDLCVLYGRGNKNLLQKMINNIFERQPKYLDDLIAAVPTVLEVFDTIENQLGLDYITELENNNEPKKLDEALSPVSTFGWNKLKDLIFYLVDTSATLNAFLDIYPQAAISFHKEGTAVKISNFYEAVFLPLNTELKNRNKDDGLKDLILELSKRISLAKSCLIRAFREIVFYCCLQPILDGQTTSAEVFLQIMSICVSDKCFICDYQQVFPFEEDIELLTQASVTIDSTSIDYVLSGIYSSYELLGKPIIYKPVPVISSVDNSLKELNDESQIPETIPNSEVLSDSVLDGACATPKLEGVELDSLVTQVLDVLDHLGEGFVEQCLEYYNYDAEKVISALLDDDLPGSLKKLDRTMKSSRKSSILANRKNIYDNDEFDVFSNDKIDKSKIHKGKREDKLEDINIVLKDKSASTLREVYQKYELVEETNDMLLYDDEYDDTYDDRNVGPEEPPSPDDMLYKRPVRTPRILEKADLSDDDNSSHSFSEKSEQQTSNSIDKPRDEFVPNPAELRRKQEERIQEMRRHNHDVKGKPRGQGQEKSTLRNRDYKEKHKSSVANHNRRFQSDRKRQRGMFPT